MDGSQGSIWAEIGLNYQKLDDGVNHVIRQNSLLDAQTQKAMDNISSHYEQMGKTMTIAISAPLTLLGRQWVNTFTDFQQSMVNTQAVIGATSEEFDLLTEAARRAGETTVYKASQAADALYFLAQAGMDTNQAIGALEGTLSLAAATQSDLAFTSEVIATSLSQFRLDAEESTRVANLYAAAISGSQASMNKLSDSMRYAGPVAAGFGHSIEETVAALMALYNAGLQGQQAGTTLRRAMQELASPTGDAVNVLKELGLVVEDIHPEFNSLVDIIELLNERGITSTQTMRLFGQQAGSGMMALLLQGSEAVRQFTEDITDTDKAIEMTKTQIDSLSGDMKIMASVYESVSISMMDNFEPVMRQVVQRITDLLSGINELTPATQKLIVTIGGFVVAAGPVMLVVSQLMKVLPILMGPAGLIYGGVAALTALGFAFTQSKQDMQAFYNQSVEMARTTQDQADSLRNLVREYKELEGKPDKSEQEHKRLEQVIKDIVSLQPDIVKGYENMDDAIRANIGTLETYIQTLEAQSELQLRMASLEYLRTRNQLELELNQLQEQRANLYSSTDINLDSVNRLVKLTSEAELKFLDYLEAIEIGSEESANEAIDSLRKIFLEVDPDHMARWGNESSPWGAWINHLQDSTRRASREVAKTLSELDKINNRIAEIQDIQESAVRVEDELNRRKLGLTLETTAKVADERKKESKTYEETVADLEETIKAEMTLYRARIDLVKYTGDEFAKTYGNLETVHSNYLTYLSGNVYDKELSLTEEFRAGLAGELNRIKEDLESVRDGRFSRGGKDPNSIVSSRMQVFNAELKLLRKEVELYQTELGTLENHLTLYSEWLQEQLADTGLSAITHAQVLDASEVVKKELDILVLTASERWEKLLGILSDYGPMADRLQQSIQAGKIEIDLEDFEKMEKHIQNFYNYLLESEQIKLQDHMEVLRYKLSQVKTGTDEWLNIWREISNIQKQINAEEQNVGTNEPLRKQLELLEQLKHDNDEAVNTYAKQAEWLHANIVNSEGLLRNNEERRSIENEIFALQMAHFRELSEAEGWKTQQQLDNLDRYVGAYATSFDQIQAYASLQRQLYTDLAKEKEDSGNEEIRRAEQVADRLLDIEIEKLRQSGQLRESDELSSFAQLQRELRRIEDDAELVELAHEQHRLRLLAIDERYSEEEIRRSNEVGYKKLEVLIQQLENEDRLYEADIQRSALRLARELEQYQNNHEMIELAYDSHYARLLQATQAHENRERQRLQRQVTDEIRSLGNVRDIDLKETKVWAEERASIFAEMGVIGIPALDTILTFQEQLLLEEQRRLREREHLEEQWTSFLIQSRQVQRQEILREQVETLESEISLIEDSNTKKLDLERELQKLKHDLAIQTLEDQKSLLESMTIEEQLSTKQRLEFVGRIRKDYEELYGENFRMSTEWQALRRQELELEKSVSEEIAKQRIKEIDVNNKSLRSLLDKNATLLKLIENTDDYIQQLEYIAELQSNQEKIREVEKATSDFFAEMSPKMADVIGKTEDLINLINQSPQAFDNMRTSMVQTFGEYGEMVAGLYGGIAGYTGAGGGVAGSIAGISGALAGLTGNPLFAGLSAGVSFISRLFDPGPVPQEMSRVKESIQDLNKELAEFGSNYRAIEADIRKKRFLGFLWTTGYEFTNEEVARAGYEAGSELIRSMNQSLQSLGQSMAQVIGNRGTWEEFQLALKHQLQSILMAEIMASVQFEQQAKALVGMMQNAVSGGYNERELENIKKRWRELFQSLEKEWEQYADILDEFFPEEDTTVTHEIRGVQITRLSGQDRDIFVELLRPIANLDRLEGILAEQFIEIYQNYQSAEIATIQAQEIIIQQVLIHNINVDLHGVGNVEEFVEGLVREAMSVNS